MGGACSTHDGMKKARKASFETLNKMDQWENPGVEGRIILKWMLVVGTVLTGFMCVRIRDHVCSVVNTQMNLRAQ
jgi:hypothetical protein